MTDTKKANFWQKLVQEEQITADQLQLAEKQATETGDSLQKIFIKLGILTEKELLERLSAFYEVPILDLASLHIKKEVIALIPENLAAKYLLIPVFKIGTTLTIATNDPLNFYGLDQVGRQTQLNVKMVLSKESSITKAIEQYYGTIDSTIRQRKAASTFEMGSAKLSDSKLEWQDDAPIVNLVNNMMEQAVTANASDIHIEPEEKFVRIRLRVDGLLHEVSTPPKDVEAGIISRVKIMAGMNIAEKRKPQDGRCKVSVKGKEVDLRISTIPTNFGENMVIRILDKQQLILPLEKLGFNETTRKNWESLIRKPHGIILVTGPTGSGKTTALYSTINQLKSPHVNIHTVEDPIEYQLDYIRQMQVNPKMDITFTSGLRSILRQDPDIIMVGEIRDRDTADIAVQAALTGHLVFSTLHTNDAASALTRLTEMGIEPYLLSSAVIGILAGRLIRVLCPACAITRPATEEDAARIKKPFIELQGKMLADAKGCKQCKEKGYTGRIGIFELLLMDQEMRQMIHTHVDADHIRQQAIARNMQTLFDNGLEKVFARITSLEELLRVSVQ